MPLLFNMLSRLVIAFLQRSKLLLISWLQSPFAVILELKRIKSVTISIVSTSIFHEVMGPDAMILAFWMLSFKPPFSLSSFTLFTFCHKGGIICLSEVWYFSWQSWFQLVTHPAWHFAWCTMHIGQISKVTICSLDVLLSQFGTSLFFHVRFYLLLLDLHTSFSGGRSGGLVFPFL